MRSRSDRDDQPQVPGRQDPLGRVVIIAVSIALYDPSLQRFASALFVLIGVGVLIAHDYHGERLFEALGTKVSAFLNLSDYGARFLFGNLADPAYYGAEGGWKGFGFLFASLDEAEPSSALAADFCSVSSPYCVGSGTVLSMRITWPGLVPHVTCGAMSLARYTFDTS